MRFGRIMIIKKKKNTHNEIKDTARGDGNVDDGGKNNISNLIMGTRATRSGQQSNLIFHFRIKLLYIIRYCPPVWK